jgi:hypothetical protein
MGFSVQSALRIPESVSAGAARLSPDSGQVTRARPEADEHYSVPSRQDVSLDEELVEIPAAGAVESDVQCSVLAKRSRDDLLTKSQGVFECRQRRTRDMRPESR